MSNYTVWESKFYEYVSMGLSDVTSNLLARRDANLPDLWAADGNEQADMIAAHMRAEAHKIWNTFPVLTDRVQYTGNLYRAIAYHTGQADYDPATYEAGIVGAGLPF